MDKKEKWSKPKLIILTRGKPEESVLAACKGANGGDNISNIADTCYDGDCVACFSLVST